MPLLARTGSLSVGTAAGVLFLIAMVTISPVSWFISGLIAGVASKGSARGALASLISALSTVFIMITITIVAPPSFLQSVYNSTGNSFIYLFLSYSLHQINSPISPLVNHIIVDFTLFSVLGGIIGGSLFRNRIYADDIAPKK
ncbi:hypothetical membrane protein [Thermoplasma acidophilum]|uniref:Hypothetical membrane protein n=1 Tax=Thermoplasma acidophilum (strain ATCC 25905 / DSM 1728 / JCM 9062 / NBRC 15155 / AMRC-C165) TaxID=273075 RepID=Q9HLL8_THEAC|nr:hypothetical protein [Thermoplasma acidophilum]CAC11355.1 hypothetical membrane protein [Thermoplasma acidophilum]